MHCRRRRQCSAVTAKTCKLHSCGDFKPKCHILAAVRNFGYFYGGGRRRRPLRKMLGWRPPQYALPPEAAMQVGRRQNVQVTYLRRFQAKMPHFGGSSRFWVFLWRRPPKAAARKKKRASYILAKIPSQNDTFWRQFEILGISMAAAAEGGR